MYTRVPVYQSSDPVYQNPVQFQGTRVQFQCTRIQFQCTRVPVYQSSVPVYQGSDPVNQSPVQFTSRVPEFSSVQFPQCGISRFCYSSQDSAHLASGHHLAPPSITWPSPASGPRPVTITWLPHNYPMSTPLFLAPSLPNCLRVWLVLFYNNPHCKGFKL